MDLAAALDYLADHVSLEHDPAPAAAARRLDRIRRLVGLMGDPQDAYPAIHLTGTNGKGSTARILTALLTASGLRVGTYTSPHLQRLNERIAHAGEPIPDDDLGEVIGAVAGLEPLLGSRLTHFEILTAAALRHFADEAVDVAVVEVGLGGRWDATNVVDAEVAAVTNVALDHVATIGPTTADIAREKAGIVKPASTVIVGETDPELAAAFTALPSKQAWHRDRDFGCPGNAAALAGRALELVVPGARYPDLFLPAHGAFQGDNAAVALAAAAAFFGRPPDAGVVAEGLAAASLPGRLEVVGHRPLVVLDGAHNPAGAVAATAAIEESFLTVPSGPAGGAGSSGETGPGSAPGRILVVGFLAGRDPEEMLRALGVADARLVVACAPPSPRALPPAAVAAAATGLGCPARVVPPVGEAVDAAVEAAGTDGSVVVTGSLYVVGAARDHLVAQP